MAAAGIIAAAAGVAGTVGSIAQQNSAARQQNEAIADQRAANRQQEEIRLMQARAQAQIITQQSNLQQQQIRQDAQLERRQLQDMRFMNNANTQLQRRANQVEMLGFGNQVMGQQQALTGMLRDTDMAGREQQTAALQQAAQMIPVDLTATQQVQNLRRDVEIQAAQSQALSGSRGRTAGMQRRLTPEQINAVAMQLMQQQGMSAEAAQLVAQSDQMRGIMTDLAGTQAAIQDMGLQDMLRNAGRQNRVRGRMLTQQRESTAGMLNNAIQQNRVAELQNLLQTEINQDFALGSLITGQALGAAQSVAADAQLRSQQRQGVSGLQSLAAITQSALPGVGQFISSQQNPQSNIPLTPLYGGSNFGGAAGGTIGFQGQGVGSAGMFGASAGLLGQPKDFSMLNTSPNIGRAGLVGGMALSTHQYTNVPSKSFYSLGVR